MGLQVVPRAPQAQRAAVHGHPAHGEAASLQKSFVAKKILNDQMRGVWYLKFFAILGTKNILVPQHIMEP